MSDILDAIPPVTLTAYARQLLADEDRPTNALILSQWLPNRLTTRRQWRVQTGTTRDFTDAAVFRAYTTPPRIGSRPGRGTQTGKMLPLSEMYLLTEEDTLDLREAVAEGGELAEAIQDDVFNDIEAGIRAIEARMEIARADALILGQITVDENGVNDHVADFGRPAANELTVATPWSTAATSTPLVNEKAAVKVLTAKGFRPEDLVTMMNDVTWERWLATTQVKEAVTNVRAPSIVTEAMATDIRSSHRLPRAIVNDAQVNNPDGSTRKVIPDDRVLVMPAAGELGETQWGVPAVATDPRIGLARDQRPGPVAYLINNLPEYATWTVVDAMGFPVLQAPEHTVVIDVS